MKKNPLVSIIIPVYNGEKFIDKCMDSVLNQTYKNLEIILTNDGSTDNSLEIIKRYAKNHENVKYDSHENVGLSKTRNIALKKVTGDYVTYLDVDDYFDLNFIEKLMDDNDDYDIVIGGYRNVYEDGKLNFEYMPKNNVWERYKRATVWAKIYKTDFLRKNKIEYPDIRIFMEDTVYTMRCLSAANKVCIKNYIGYNNVINYNSITHKENYKILKDVPKAIKEIDSYIFNQKNYIKNNERIIKFYYFKLLIAYLVDLSRFLPKDELIKYYNENRQSIKNIYKKYGYNQKIHMIKEEQLKVKIIILLFILSEKLHLTKSLIKLISNKFNEKK